MSSNVAREVCLYLGELPALLHYENRVMFRIHPVKRTREHFFDCMFGRGSVLLWYLQAKKRSS